MDSINRSSQTSTIRSGDLDEGPHATITIDLRHGEFSRDHLAPIVLALAEIPSFGCSIALLASQKTYPIACMISVLAGASRKNVGVFRSPAEAQSWLDSRQVNLKEPISKAA